MLLCKLYFRSLYTSSEQEEYGIICRLLKNAERFSILPHDRTKEQSEYVKYFRSKKKLSLDKRGLILFEGKRVLKKDEIKQCVLKTFKKTKYLGYKELRMRALDGYAGISHTNILKVTSNDVDFKGITVKAKPRPATTKEVCYFCCFQPILFEK